MSIRQAIDAYQRGDFSTTDKLCEIVLARQPGNAAAWELRGLAVWRTGHLDDALNYLNAAVRADPANPSHHFNLGRFLASTGDLARAASSFRRVLEHSPQDAEAMTFLGNIQLQLNDITGAIELQQRAATLQPDNALVLNNLGIALVRRKNLADAVPVFKRAQQLAPELIEVSRNIAVYSEMSGNIVGAQFAVDAAMKNWPDDATLNLVSVKLLLRSGNAQLALEITEKFRERTDDFLLAGDFAFAHASALEQAADYAAAFQQFQTANRLAKERVENSNFSPSRLMNHDLVDTLLAYYSEQPAAGDPLDIDDDFTDPVFIVGMPRSGTTLLDSILGSGLNADVLEEEGTVFALLVELDRSGIAYPNALDKIDEQLVRRLRQAYFDGVSNIIPRTPAALLVDKMPFNLLHVGLLLRVFPRARIIRALRHPANVALSNFKQNYDDPDSVLLFSEFESIVNLSDKFDKLWSIQTVGHAAGVMTVKFEDLVSETASTVEKLFKFLGFDEATLDDAARREYAQKKLSHVTPNYSSVVAPLDARNSSQWQNYSAELAPYLDRLMTLATKQGYDDSTE